MRKNVIFVIISMLFFMSSCSIGDTTGVVKAANIDLTDEIYEIINQEDLIIGTLMENDINMNSRIDICSPFYVNNLDIDNNYISQDSNVIHFPVLENEEFIGVMIYYTDSNVLNYMTISQETKDDILNGNDILIANARWGVDDDYCSYANAYIAISSKKTYHFSMVHSELFYPPHLDYQSFISKLTSLNMKNLVSIKSFNINKNSCKEEHYERL